MRPRFALGLRPRDDSLVQQSLNVALLSEADKDFAGAHEPLFAKWGELHLLANSPRMVRTLAIVLCIWFAVGILTGCGRHTGARGAYSPEPTISGADVRHGKLVYERECAACHGQAGVNGPIGPSLKDEHTRKSFEAVRAIVTDPDPPMPKLYPSRLTRADVTDVSAYVESL